MKYLIILTALYSASAALAGGSGGTMGSPNRVENFGLIRDMPSGAVGLQTFSAGSVLNDLSKLETLLQTQVLSEDEEALVREELSKTNLRFKALLQKLEASGVDTQDLEIAAP